MPNLTGRFASWLQSDVRAREQLSRIEKDVDRIGASENAINLV
jgi:hypothetical protein